MIKKYIPLLLIVALLICLLGCGSPESGAELRNESDAESLNENRNETDKPAESVTTAPQTESVTTAPQTESVTTAPAASPEEDTQSAEREASSLVLYFSRTGEQYRVGVIDKGNTAIVAEIIAEQKGADLFEILPAYDRYPMTYDELTEMAKKEQNDQARPSYAGQLPDLARYDTVFIGAPVWWGDWPMILYTVFETNNFSGKTLIPFCTHEGSGLSGFDRKLASACPDSEVPEGLAVRGSDAQNNPESVSQTVADWLTQLGYGS